MTSRIRTLGAASLAAATLVLAACSPPNEQDTTESKVDTASDVAAPTKSASATKSTSPTTTQASSDSMTADASTTTGLKDGDKVTVKLTGLDPTMGYYAAICAEEATPGNPVPVCTGKNGDSASQAWIKAEGGTTAMAEDGTATVTLTAASTGEGIDCTVDACVLKVFGDHAQNFADITSVPVTFAK